MKFLAVLLIFCHFCTVLSAQQPFNTGYIIKTNRDTVRGFIQFGQEKELSRSVKFREGSSATVNEFTPSDILGFSEENEIYKSLHFLNTAEDSVKETAFVKLLVTGEYSLYAYTKEDMKFSIARSFLSRLCIGVCCFVIADFKSLPIAGNSLNESHLNIPTPFCPLCALPVGHFPEILIKTLNLICILNHSNHVLTVDCSKAFIILIIERLYKRFPHLLIDLPLKAVGLGDGTNRQKNQPK